MFRQQGGLGSSVGHGGLGGSIQPPLPPAAAAPDGNDGSDVPADLLEFLREIQQEKMASALMSAGVTFLSLPMLLEDEFKDELVRLFPLRLPRTFFVRHVKARFPDAVAASSSPPQQRSAVSSQPQPRSIKKKKRWLLDPKLVVIDYDAPPLGRGQFGVVYQGEFGAGLYAIPVAVKVISLMLHPKGPHVAREFVSKEVETMATLRHPHILRAFGCWFASRHAYVVLEMCSKGTLEAFLKKNSPPLVDRKELLAQIAGGMQFVHSHGVVHRDLKPENLLIGDDGKVKICDFGLARHAGSISGKTIAGSPRYMANRKIFKEPKSRDIYSFGILAYEVLSGRRAFQDFEDMFQSGDGDGYDLVSAIHSSGKVPDVEHLSAVRQDVRGLVASCWTPAKQPTFAELNEGFLRQPTAPPEPEEEGVAVPPLPPAAVAVDAASTPEPKKPEEQTKTAVPEKVNFSRVVIIDIGTYETKAGFNDEDEPSVLFKTCFDEKYPLAEHTSHYTPRGCTTSMDVYTKIFDKIYEGLGVSPTRHPVLMGVMLNFPKPVKEDIVRLLFQKYQIPALNMTTHGILNMFSFGLDTKTGVSVEMGEGVTQILPVYQGVGLATAMKRMNIAGRDVIKFFQTAVKGRGVSLDSFSDREQIRKWSEELFFCAEDFVSEVRRFQKEQHCTTTIDLPDGQKLTIGLERFMAPEVYFSTEHLDVPNLAEVIVASLGNIAVRKIGFESERQLWGNIILSGGMSRVPGLLKRLQVEIKKKGSKSVKTVMHHSKYSVFVGGSIMSSQASFEHVVLTMRRFKELGPRMGAKAIHSFCSCRFI